MLLAAGVGHSTYPLTDAAGREAATRAMEQAGVDRADLVLLFATFDHAVNYPLLFQAVARVCGTQEIVGCSASGILTTQEEIEFRPGVAVMVVAAEDLSLAGFLATSEPQGEEVLAQTIAERVGSQATASACLALMTDVFSVDASRLIAQLESLLGPVPVIGAASSGPAHVKKTYQWYGPSITEHGVAGVLLPGSLHSATVIAQGCTPIGEPRIVTKAQGNLILEMASRPAVDALAEAVHQLPPDDLPEASRSIFVGIAMDERKYPLKRGDYLVCNILGFEEDTGALLVAQEVNEGQTVQFQFRHSQAAREEMEGVLMEAAKDRDRAAPAFGLYFNCMGRGYGLYREPDHDVKAIRRALGPVPIIGFFGNAEFAPIGGRNLVHSYTGVLTLVSPAPR